MSLFDRSSDGVARERLVDGVAVCSLEFVTELLGVGDGVEDEVSDGVPTVREVEDVTVSLAVIDGEEDTVDVKATVQLAEADRVKDTLFDLEVVNVSVDVTVALFECSLVLEELLVVVPDAEAVLATVTVRVMVNVPVGVGSKVAVKVTSADADFDFVSSTESVVEGDPDAISRVSDSERVLDSVSSELAVLDTDSVVDGDCVLDHVGEVVVDNDSDFERVGVLNVLELVIVCSIESVDDVVMDRNRVSLRDDEVESVESSVLDFVLLAECSLLPDRLNVPSDSVTVLDIVCDDVAVAESELVGVGPDREKEVVGDDVSVGDGPENVLESVDSVDHVIVADEGPIVAEGDMTRVSDGEIVTVCSRVHDLVWLGNESVLDVVLLCDLQSVKVSVQVAVRVRFGDTDAVSEFVAESRFVDVAVSLRATLEMLAVTVAVSDVVTVWLLDLVLSDVALLLALLLMVTSSVSEILRCVVTVCVAECEEVPLLTVTVAEMVVEVVLDPLLVAEIKLDLEKESLETEGVTDGVMN